MASVKSSALSSLATVISGLSFVETVVQTDRPIVLSDYAQADLPLVEIRHGDGSPNITRGMQYEEYSIVVINVYFLNWAKSSSLPLSYHEALIEGIDYGLNVAGAALDLDSGNRYSPLTELEYPLDGFQQTFNLRIQAGFITDI